MARKGNQQKNGMDRGLSDGKKGISDSGPAVQNTEGRVNENEMKDTLGEELPNSNHSVMPQAKSRNDTSCVQDEKKSKKKSKKSLRRENKSMDAAQGEKPAPEEVKTDVPTVEVSNVRDTNEFSPESNCSPQNLNSFTDSQNELHAEDRMGNVELADTEIFKWMRTCALAISKVSIEWVERYKPMFVTLKTNVLKARDYVRRTIEHVQPIVFRWIMYFGNTMLLLLMVWLDCAVRGMDSLLRMGTTSVFSIIWFGVLSTVAMVGMMKFLLVLAISAVIGLFAGFTLASVFIFFAGATFLWLYGSFWTSGLVITLSGGLAFILGHDRIALFITTLYSMYCAWTYVGWVGVLCGLNLSFFSSDVLLYVLRNTLEQRGPNMHAEQAAGMQGQPSFFPRESMHASSSGIGADVPEDRNPGVPSTSGSDSEMTSEDEVVRLLNCKDHYSAFGLSRFQNVDLSVIKREYRKKAMLVHPDKNMGNEKAAEAFKKLQNAYEVLLDSFKRKEYDDELRREELLNFFRNIQNGSQENKGRTFAASSFARTEADGEDPLGESRRIACRKCGYFHVWFHTKKLKSRARWCQDCKDFHQAKDGDGWVEQSSQPLFFGILQKVVPPAAYVCADSKIYDATEWYICQGMRCPVNTHKPSFHVNTSVMSKNNNGKGSSSGQSRGGNPTHNMEETMTEEEFFEWLQNAMQSGMFENFAGSSTSDGPPTRNAPKTEGGNSSSAGSKRKKKGKKQR
ncbi:Chaperone DnaJ-domain superfamily protein [Forsythia ovata]|uniref:Chaperone DnaJ-domain superfamily protein n=1 Tax=Forsythia ovata TaxID=205694 RepID=A0ABD1P794_9LAMI